MPTIEIIKVFEILEGIFIWLLEHLIRLQTLYHLRVVWPIAVSRCLSQFVFIPLHKLQMFLTLFLVAIRIKTHYLLAIVFNQRIVAIILGNVILTLNHV